MAGQSQPLSTQVYWFRLAGAALYTSAVALLALCACRAVSWPLHPQSVRRTLIAIVSPYTNLLLAAFCVLQCAVVAAQSQLLVATEPRPLALPSILPAGPGSLQRALKGGAALAARFAAHGRSLKGIQGLAALFCGSIAAGVGSIQLFLAVFGAPGVARRPHLRRAQLPPVADVELTLLTRGRGRMGVAVWRGSGLGARPGRFAEVRRVPRHAQRLVLAPSARSAVLQARRGEDVLRFPVVQQRRIFRVKKEAPHGARTHRHRSECCSVPVSEHGPASQSKV